MFAKRSASIEYFSALYSIPICRHAFIERIPGIDVSHGKAEALKRLDAVHREARRSLGMGDWPLLTAQQIHGDKIAMIDFPVTGDTEFAGCDGIITNQKKIALGHVNAERDLHCRSENSGDWSGPLGQERNGARDCIESNSANARKFRIGPG